MELGFKIVDVQGYTKLQRLVNSIVEAVDTGVLKEGDNLPSVNVLSRVTGFSRDTVFKAFKILKQRSIIQSTPTKGYFVAGQSFRVFMLLDDFSTFKEQLYRAFRNNLPATYSVDLHFHHYQPEVFRSLIQNSLGRYSMYIVMNIDNKGIDPVVRSIDPHKLLILDMGNPGPGEISYIIQDFNEAVVDCLSMGIEKLKKYREFILVYSKKETPHPHETVTGFCFFCQKNGIRHRVVPVFDNGKLKKGQAYFVIRESDLVQIIKSCNWKGLLPGTDVGIITYNDTPMKEITCGGISVVSTDFESMGRLTAEFIRSKTKVQKVLPTSLILRNTL